MTLLNFVLILCVAVIKELWLWQWHFFKMWMLNGTDYNWWTVDLQIFKCDFCIESTFRFPLFLSFRCNSIFCFCFFFQKEVGESDSVPGIGLETPSGKGGTMVTMTDETPAVGKGKKLGIKRVKKKPDMNISKGKLKSVNTPKNFSCKYHAPTWCNTSNVSRHIDSYIFSFLSGTPLAPENQGSFGL